MCKIHLDGRRVRLKPVAVWTQSSGCYLLWWKFEFHSLLGPCPIEGFTPWPSAIQSIVPKDSLDSLSVIAAILQSHCRKPHTFDSYTIITYTLNLEVNNFNIIEKILVFIPFLKFYSFNNYNYSYNSRQYRSYIRSVCYLFLLLSETADISTISPRTCWPATRCKGRGSSHLQ